MGGARSLVRWLVALVVLGSLHVVAFRAVQPEPVAAVLERFGPLSAGRAWAYASRTNGAGTGVHTVAVVGRSQLLNGAASALESHWDDFLGTGPRRRVTYMGVQGGALVVLGERDGGTYQAYDPPQLYLTRPPDQGPHEFAWQGKVGGQEQRQTTTLVGTGPESVAGVTLDDCRHYRTAITIASVERRSETWLCAGVGLVRSHEEAPDLGVVLDEELIGFRAPDRAAGTLTLVSAPEPPVSSAAGETAGVDNGRTNSVGGATVDLGRPAWSDARKVPVRHPPVGRAGVVVLAESDGTCRRSRPRPGRCAGAPRWRRRRWPARSSPARWRSWPGPTRWSAPSTWRPASPAGRPGSPTWPRCRPSWPTAWWWSPRTAGPGDCACRTGASGGRPRWPSRWPARRR